MKKSSVRLFIRSFFRTLMKKTKKNIDLSDLERSAIIFAPHQDDEVLGCGGTILQKKKLGANIKIVFMTDGSSSHKSIEEEELKSIRANEAKQAASKLNIPSDDIIFLNIKDGKLGEFHEYAVSEVQKIIQGNKAEEIYIPYYDEPAFVSDHSATYNAVISALEKDKSSVSVYEYPIWFWRQYPWTFEKYSNFFGALAQIPRGLVKGLKFCREFGHGVCIEDMLPTKREALAQHKSQMERFNNDPKWTTLNDFSEGQWLECFFQSHEYFRRYQYVDGIRSHL